MSTPSLVALVTGSNKGIGLGIVKELCRQQFAGTIYLTARDAGRGREAVAKLKEEGFSNVEFLFLDVLDRVSIEKARDAIKQKHGGLDILVNNAGVFMADLQGGALKSDDSVEGAQRTFATNFYGLLNCCKIFFPILRSHARVVNVSSSFGSLRHLKIQSLKNRLVADDLTVEEIEKIAADYLLAVEKGNPANIGYPENYGAYSMSKILVTALSIVQQREFDRDISRSDIVVNACCPGFVATDINQHLGTKTVEQGADTPTYLALLPPHKSGEPVTPRGELVYERVVKDWKNDQ